MKKIRNRVILLTALAAALCFIAGPAFSQGFTIDFSSATGFPVPGEPEKLQTDNVIVNLLVTNPLTGDVITTTIPANVVWRFDYTLAALVIDGAEAANPPNTCDALPSLTVNVTNALTGAAIQNATVGASGESGQTDATGAVTLTGLPASSMPVSVSANGYVSSTQTVELECGDQESIGVSLLPEDDPGVIAGDIRIILNWGDNPRDLDSHLTKYEESVRLRADTVTSHVYYANTSDATIPASLDVDDQNGNGPETITIQKVDGAFNPGTYRYNVHHYAGSSTIPESGATVKVYMGDILMGTYTTPAAGGSALAVKWAWRVFRITISDDGSVAFTTLGEYYGPVNNASDVD